MSVSWLIRAIGCTSFLDKQPQPVAHPYFGVEFLRGRKGEAPMSGYGFHLVFDQEVKGPFALGALAHFGLGVFVPAS